ncbi:MAG: HAMP domain-containing histidine kinase [Acidobacteriota bacterium]|nr:HAMP domain-containing histidine kinase [Acidobacteriota bacterium]
MKTPRRVPFRVIVPVLLMAIVAVLAVLQYRWLGQVSQAERQRMQETMTARAQALADDLDHEIARVYVAFQLRGAEMPAVDAALARRYRMWREASARPSLIREILVGRGDGTLQTLDLARGTLSPVEWPAELESIRVAHTRVASAAQGSNTFSFRFPQTISANPLAVAVMLPFDLHRESLEARHVMRSPGFVLLRLDETALESEILPALAAQHLGESLDEYRLTVLTSGADARVVYQTDGTTAIEPSAADVRVEALSLRAAIADRVLATELRATAAYAAGLEASRTAPPAPPAAPPQRPDRLTVFIQQPNAVTRRPSAGAIHQQPGARETHPTRISTMSRAVALGGGAWQVLLKHRAGSLEAAVQQVRRRNLIMSFGMLALLAASVGLVLVSARRAERLASQQMDFVATVSHELRTPLAVIRSAGQNLAAGVVQDTKRYGDLIETEGRRLTDMVEQTLALAGLSGGRRPVAQQVIDAGNLVRGVVASTETTTQAGDVAIDLRVAEELPLVPADDMLLRRGVQNLIANALKYARSGGWIGVTVDAHGRGSGAGWGAGRREVRISVTDRGPGVAAEDLPHIFEPFYRGRRAVAEQVQGNGLGLHLVKRIAEAHGGRVTVRSTPGEGAIFTIHIPAGANPALQPSGAEQPFAAMGRRGPLGPRERLS